MRFGFMNVVCASARARRAYGSLYERPERVKLHREKITSPGCLNRNDTGEAATGGTGRGRLSGKNISADQKEW